MPTNKGVPTNKKASQNAKASAKVRAAQQQKRQRLQWSIGIVALVVVGIVVLVLAKMSTSDSGNTAKPQHTPKPAPASVTSDLAAVPLTAIAAAAKSGVSTNPVKPISGGKLRTANGKPEVLYMGGEFCPYCAGERWALTVALSKFGTFKNLQVVHSAESDVPTLTYLGSDYTSKYLTFTPKEIKGNEPKGRSWVDLEKATDEQMKLLSELGGGSFPFIDFGGKYFQSGGSVDVTTLLGKSQTEIAAALAASTTKDTSQSSLEGNVNLVAGEFIRTICGLTDNQPANVCKAFPQA